MRALKLTLALAAAALVGVAGASAVVPTAPTESDVIAAVTPDGSGSSIAATAADPAGGDRRWGVRVYRSQTGQTCQEPGRTVGADFGRVDGDGSFHPNKLEAAGSCADLAKAPYSIVVARFPGTEERGARSLVYGAVSDRVAAVSVTTVSGARRDLAITRGAYLLPLTAAEGDGATIAITLADGTIERRTLTRGDG